MLKPNIHYIKRTLFLIYIALLGFCIHGNTQEYTKNLKIEIQGNRLKHEGDAPLRVKVKHHDQITWQITSDTKGELHLHAYGIEMKVPANKMIQYRFEAKASGKFQIEWHPDDVGQNMTQQSHHAPLAYFEVYPQ